ncbi:nucleoside phosphorylase domain-containing protein [Gigaspora rosea]|uniref:Nucleoside phosphorylase domain-containing protein n=1 Tax=Gigaspora rosea TaxID=44941 RepID=A0A397V204_9GLOM|nr:nucleoside phosphorylase domain-containing protein [Gigaspora rosea]
MSEKFFNANFPKSADGRVSHIGIKRGEIANRIITVGDLDRAKLFLKLLDSDTAIFQRQSHRGFLTITGKYKGVPVSIVGIGMGLSMMDFFVREARAIIDGTMIIIRVGTCGTIGKSNPGDVIISEGSFAVTRNYDYPIFENKMIMQDYEIKTKERPYNMSKVFYGDEEICNLVITFFFAKKKKNSYYSFLTNNVISYSLKIRKQLINSGIPNSQVIQGLNATCDSFYSSQGRHDENFEDYNKGLIESIRTKYPEETESLEMETFMLYYLAKCSTDAPYRSQHKVRFNSRNSIRAAATMIGIFNRKTNETIDPDKLNYLERTVGEAVLKVLLEIGLDEEHIGDDCVWNLKVKSQN